MGDQPDIEIYVKHLDLAVLSEWLNSVFTLPEQTSLDQVDLDRRASQTVEIEYDKQPISLVITPGAAGKSYTSLWFQSEYTPWASDLKCAEAALDAMQTEIRCSAESWNEEEPEYSEKWWKLDGDQRELIAWG